MAKLLWYGFGACVLVVAAGAGLYLMSVYGRSPRPVPLGTVVWDYECGFSVTGIQRHKMPKTATTAYDVTARVFCPYGERYVWTAQSAHVIDNSERPYYPASQTAPHKVLGVTDTEYLTFVLPDTIEQPALVFDDTQSFESMIDELSHGSFYQRLRFNLRYD